MSVQRVVLVTPAVFGPGRKGGGERYVSELARALASTGRTVRILRVRSYLRADLLNASGEVLRSLGLSDAVRLLRAADVVHVHQLNSIGFDVAVLARIRSSARLVLTDHGGGMRAVGRLLGRARLMAVDAAAFVSNWSRLDVDPRGRVRNYSVVFGGGDHLPVPRVTVDAVDVLFVGRLLPHKGAHVLIAALPDSANCLIIGEERDANYAQLLKRLAHGKSVRFSPDAEDEDVAAALDATRVLVVPSVTRFEDSKFTRPELLGLVALEALAAGKPVVGSDLGGLGEVLHFAGQRVFPDGDVLALRGQIEATLESDTLRPVSPGAFTWAAVASRCLDLYESVG